MDIGLGLEKLIEICQDLDEEQLETIRAFAYAVKFNTIEGIEMKHDPNEKWTDLSFDRMYYYDSYRIKS